MMTSLCKVDYDVGISAFSSRTFGFCAKDRVENQVHRNILSKLSAMDGETPLKPALDMVVKYPAMRFRISLSVVVACYPMVTIGIRKYDTAKYVPDALRKRINPIIRYYIRMLHRSGSSSFDMQGQATAPLGPRQVDDSSLLLDPFISPFHWLDDTIDA